MQQILFFLIRNKNFLLFLFLFVISFFLTVQSHSFHQNKFINSANFFSGGIYSIKNNITDYFKLRGENTLLTEDNAQLKKQLEAYRELIKKNHIDTTSLYAKFNFVTAKVINNSFHKSKNVLTINKGIKSEIEIDQGVISSRGLVGIIKNTSSNYATIQSILNTNSQVNTKLKKSNHFGTLIWNTKDPNMVQLIDIPRLAPLIKGDTIITGGKSMIFPEGILVGTIHDFTLNQDKNSYTVNVTLFNDMTNLEHVYIISNKDALEIKSIESEEDAE